MKLSLKEGKSLIILARHSIETYFSKINISKEIEINDKRGVFVTLRKFDSLRGCIGFPYPVYELDRAIIEASRAAAFNDPRFPPLTKEELDDVSIEISVLTEPRLIEVESPIEYIDKIKIGVHGLIVKKDLKSGLLLPQVFTDHDSTPREALELTCQKAGLDEDAWKEAEVYSFEAQIFEEKEPHGEIVENKK